MDSLQKLPIDEKDTVTPQKESVLQKYFPKRDKKVRFEGASESSDQEKCEKPAKLKYVIYATIIALIAFNPWLDLLMLKLSFLSNTLTRFGIKIALFIVMMAAAVYLL
jgi:hypothetical protein